jgi:hypothetical protein
MWGMQRIRRFVCQLFSSSLANLLHVELAANPSALSAIAFVCMPDGPFFACRTARRLDAATRLAVGRAANPSLGSSTVELVRRLSVGY